MTKREIDIVINLILQDAESRRNGAGADGRWDDGGASELETQVKFYGYGVSGILPPQWKKYADQVKKESDPEYELYKRLHEKFKDD